MKNEILTSFINTCKQYPGNSNSLHKLGVDAKRLEDAASKQILSVLSLNNKEVVYTSGQCESNNLVIYGLVNNHHKNKIIVIGNNSSIEEILRAYKQLEIVNIPIIDGIMIEDELKKVIDKNTLLITTCYFDDLDAVLKVAKNNNIYLHIDISNMDNVKKCDGAQLITVCYNELLGIGALIKDKNINLIPLIHGGKSTTIYRSGTPALPLIVAFSKLVKLKHKK